LPKNAQRGFKEGERSEKKKSGPPPCTLVRSSTGSEDKKRGGRDVPGSERSTSWQESTCQGKGVFSMCSTEGGLERVQKGKEGPSHPRSVALVLRWKLFNQETSRKRVYWKDNGKNPQRAPVQGPKRHQKTRGVPIRRRKSARNRKSNKNKKGDGEPESFWGETWGRGRRAVSSSKKKGENWRSFWGNPL